MEPLDAVLAARAMLSEVTPLRRDCGRCCGAACCQSDEDGQGGMLLFPGEEALYAGKAGFRLERNDQVLPGLWLLTCEGSCRREERPLSCRLFPLLPKRGGAVMDQRAWAVCPLMASGIKGLQPAFTEAVKTAGERLYACPEHAAFLDALHAFNKKLTEW